MRRHRPIFFATVAALALTGLMMTGCGGGGDDKADGSETTGTSTASTAPDVLQAVAANYDLAVGPPGRFILGLFNQARGPVGYGTTELRFSFLGTDQAKGAPQPGPTVAGSYLPLPGSAPPAPPAAGRPAYLATDQRGVYAADVAFDRPGFWQVKVTLDLDGPKTAQAAFAVLARHEVPAPGDAAIPSQNLTVSTPGAPPEAIDSRANATTPVPDADLHQATVAQALAERRPVLLAISTPTFCLSMFCGPVTDMVDELAKDYANRARFIHIEVWKDFKSNVLNDAAKEWIARGQNVNEPWVFLIGGDGKIKARWDNVATRGEIEPLLQQLPVRAP